VLAGAAPGGRAGSQYPGRHSRAKTNRKDHRQAHGTRLRDPAPDSAAAYRLGGYPVRRIAGLGDEEITQLLFHRTHRASCSIKPASCGSSRSLASACDIVAFTVPTAQFSMWAT